MEIERALERIKEAKALDKGLICRVFQLYPKEIETIEKVINAMEIIKEKKVNLECVKSCENYEQYKTICSYWNEITKNEFDLLKEVLL